MADEINKKVQDNEPQEEEESSIVELTDEDGVTTEFEYLTTIEYEGDSYVVLMAPQEEDHDEEGEVVILKIEVDANGEDTYVSCENDEVAEAVFDRFMEELDEEELEDAEG